MAEIKKISTEFQLLDKFLDTSGDAGTSGQVLSSTATGINWVSGSSLPGGPYLPLSAGSTNPLTGDLYIEEDSIYLLNASSNYWRVQTNSSGKLTFKQGTTQRGIWSSGELQLANNLIVDSKVGIGTTSPDSPLEIEFAEDTGTSKQMLHLDYNPVDNYGSALFKISSGSSANNIFEIEQVTGGGAGDFGTYVDTNIINRNVASISAGNINFVTGSNTSPSSIVMTIGGGNQKGNVGIGTTSPGAKLEVRASASTPFGALRLSTSSTKYWQFNTVYGYTDPDLFIAPNGGAATMTLQSTGNVGIGTDSPGNFTGLSFASPILDVAGVIQSKTGNIALGGTSYRKAALMTSTGTDGPYLDLRVATSGTSSNTTTRMRISANGNVGIGTTSPSVKLEVNGSAGVAAFFKSSSNTVPVSVFNTGNTLSTIGFKGSTSTSEYHVRVGADSKDFVAYTNNTEKLRILENGNVGIGTTSPNQDGFGSSATVLSIKAKTQGGSANTELIGLGNNDNDQVGMLGFMSQSATSPLATIRALRHTSDTSGKLTFDTAGSEKMRIDSAGNVGIQNTSPSSFDTWQRQLVVGSGSADAGITIYHGSGSGNQGAISFADGNTGTDRYRGIISYNGADEMKFFTSTLERMRINSSGLINFSKTATTATAVASINHASNDFLYINGGTAGTAIGDDDQNTRAIFYNNDYIRFDAAGSERMRIEANGNVGINETSPDAKLHVMGTTGLPATSGTTFTGTMRLGVSGGYGTVMDFGGVGPVTGTQWIQVTDASNQAIQYPLLLQPNGGNVGIGTTAPSELLELKPGSGGDAKISMLKSDGSQKALIGYDDSNGGLINLYNEAGTTNVVVRGYGNSYFNGGNFGIGTTNPGSKLQVYSAASSNVFITGYGTSAQNDWGAQNAMFVKTDNGLVISKQNAPNNTNRLYTFYNDASGNAEQYIYNTSNTATIKLDSAGDSYFNGGDVGIGTTSPDTLLQATNTADGTNYISYEIGNSAINANNKGGFAIYEFAAKQATLEYYRDGSGKFEIASQGASNHISLSTTAVGNTTPTERIRITSSGKVGIGTPSPNGILHVKGSTDDTVVYIDTNNNAISDTASIQFNDRAKVGWFDSAVYLGDNGQNKDIKLKVNSGDIISLTSNTERMRITSAGNVGIGTTSPSRKLDVVGVIQAQGNFYSTVSSSSTNLATANGGQLSLYNSNSTDNNFNNIGGYNSNSLVTSQICFVNESHANRTGAIAFLTHNGSSMPERMRITSAGNVGIGTSSPNQKLQVGGNLHVYDEEGDTDASIFLSTGTSNVTTVKIASNGDSFLNSGNVGIGTTSPGSKLEVSSGPGANGDCILTVSADTDNSTATSNPKLLMLQKGSTKTSLIEMDSSNRTHFSNSDGYYFSGGNVGIGTTSPGRPLSVNSDTSHKAIRILENDSGNESWDIGVDAEGDLNFFNSADTSPTVSFLDNGNATFAGTVDVDGSLNLDNDLDVGATATFNDQTFFYDDLNISGGIIDSDTTITATNFILSSDERLKENVKKVCDNRVKVDWKTFELKTEKGQKRYGVIAQELEKTNPEFVRENNQGFKSVAYIDLLIAKIAELEARLEKLEK